MCCDVDTPSVDTAVVCTLRNTRLVYYVYTVSAVRRAVYKFVSIYIRLVVA
jgi:hypothetical protein